MALKLKSDKVLFLAAFLLVCVSVVMVYVAYYALAADRYQNAEYYLWKQLSVATVGLFALWVLMHMDYRNYRQPVVIWTALVGITVLLVAVLFSREVGGARRWLWLFGIGVQPSEFAKLVVILFSAAILDRRMNRINDIGYALAPIAIVLATVSILILLEPDLGTAVSIIAIVGVMTFTAGLSFRYLLRGGLIILPLFVAVVAYSPERWARWMTFMNPWEDPLGDGWQVIQSQIAVGTGGILGVGRGAGVQQLGFLPEPHTDFIYAVIAEETGLIGATAVLLCFCVVAWRGARIALRAPDRFGAFIAIGLTTMLTLQAFMNISVVLSLLPTTGIPLPFVSSGGSSLLCSLVGMGVLLNVSQHASAEG